MDTQFLKDALIAFTPLSFIVGYLALASYLLPYGIAPPVNLYFLPTLLLGSLFTLLALYIAQWLLYFPLIILYYPQATLRILTDGVVTEFSYRLIRRLFHTGALYPVYYIARHGGIVTAAFVCFQLLVLLSLSIAAWIFLYRTIPDKSTLMVLAIWHFLIFCALNVVLNNRHNSNYRFRASIIALVLLIIAPAISFEPDSDTDWALTPNSFIRDSLRFLGTGGERIVSIDGPHSRIHAKLLLFDGYTAWYVPCDDTAIHAKVPHEIRFLEGTCDTNKDE